MPLRIGIVGAGATTRHRHIPGFRALRDVEIVAVCNRSRDSGQRVADEFGIPLVFDDWKALIQSDDVDAVCVGTWPDMHAPVTLEALAAGKHLLTEARMAADLEQAREMLAASERSDCVAMIVPAPYYLESERVLLEQIAEGTFGDLLLAGALSDDLAVRELPAVGRASEDILVDPYDREGRLLLGLGVVEEDRAPRRVVAVQADVGRVQRVTRMGARPGRAGGSPLLRTGQDLLVTLLRAEGSALPDRVFAEQ